MTPQVLISMLRDKEFFVVDEDITAEDLLLALKTMKNGKAVLYRLLILMLQEVQHAPSDTG